MNKIIRRCLTHESLRRLVSDLYMTLSVFLRSGDVLGCEEYEAIPAGERVFAKRGVRGRRSGRPLKDHSQHKSKP